MAISNDQKVDYLWKKLGYGVSKTDISSIKDAVNESIPSPLFLRGDVIWAEADAIPEVIPGSTSGVVTVYPTSLPVQCTADITSSTNRTWKTGITDWIPPELGATYLIKVYIHTSGDAANAASAGTQVLAAGSGNNDEWFFDYQSGTLNFIGTNLPSGVNFTNKSVYISGAVYSGQKGVLPAGSDVEFGDINITGIATVGQRLDVDYIARNQSGNYLRIQDLNFPSGVGSTSQTLTISQINGGVADLQFTDLGAAASLSATKIYVSQTGSDSNDGVTGPVRTIKKASQLASFYDTPVTILVETGEYLENNPIILYENVSIVGDSLRNVVIRPQHANADIFRVRNGCYLTGFVLKDYVTDGVPQYTWNYAIAFDDVEDASVSRTGYSGSEVDIVDVTYNNNTGITTVTTQSEHNFRPGSSVRLAGIAFTCGYEEIGISTFVYDNTTGVSTITFFSDSLLGESGSGYSQKGYKIGDELYLNNLPFSCAAEHAGVTTTIFPYPGLDPVYGAVYPITGINTAAKTVTIIGAASTIPHIYEGYPTIGISTFSYDNVTGIATATTSSDHGFTAGQKIALEGLEFSCAAEHAGITTTIFPDGTITNYTSDGYTFTVGTVIDSTTFSYNVGVSTIAHTYEGGGTVRKVPTVQEVWTYPDRNSNGQTDFGIVKINSPTQFTVKCPKIPEIPHYYTQGGTAKIGKSIISQSPYIQNASVISFLGGGGVLVDGNKVTTPNTTAIAEESEFPAIGDQPEFGKSMVASAFTLVSFGGIGYKAINDGYAQLVSVFQIFCQEGSSAESGGYLSITNSATNFGTYALKSTGYSKNSFAFDRGIIVETSIIAERQALKLVGMGASDQNNYVLRFHEKSTEVDKTGTFKAIGAGITSFDSSVGVNTTTDEITVEGHGFSNKDTLVYVADSGGDIGGLYNGGEYYVGFVGINTFKLYNDISLTIPVDLTAANSGIHTFYRANHEFFVKSIESVSSRYQVLELDSDNYTFVPGRLVTQSASSASGYVVGFTSSSLTVSNESVSDFLSSATIEDHAPSPASATVNSAVGITTYYTLEVTIDSTDSTSQSVQSIASLNEDYYCYFSRPSIVNSSSHTWEYAGSGNDYNALPQNGGKGIPEYEQVNERGGRVYTSGTNELGDFKVGDSIRAFNRTGNIVFNNTVQIGELTSLKFSVGSGPEISEISTDPGLGDNEVGGASNSRITTQLAQKEYLTTRLGSFIDKTASTSSVPNALVILNASGQINSDLISANLDNSYYSVFEEFGRLSLVDNVPANNLLAGDLVLENTGISTITYRLVNDRDRQYLVLSDSTRNYNFDIGNNLLSVNNGAVGVVTAPNNVGYGTTGLVKGVLVSADITSGGSGYVSGIYTGVSIASSTGVGSSVRGTVTVGAAGTVTSVDFDFAGRDYVVGDVLRISSIPISGTNYATLSVSSVQTRLYTKLNNNIRFAATPTAVDYIQDNNVVGLSTDLQEIYTATFDALNDVDVNFDRIGIGSNDVLSDGDAVIYNNLGGNVITGLTNNQIYYVKKVGISSVELYSTYALTSIVNLTSTGTGTQNLTRVGINTRNNFITLSNHGYSAGTVVKVSGADLPSGLTNNTFYYVGSVVDNAFSLHSARSDALLSFNGLSVDPVSLGSTGSGTITFEEQNVQFVNVINTSSTIADNWSVLSSNNIDASNIVSGTVTPSRLGSGSATADTFLSGNSTFKRVAQSVGIGTTQPILVLSSYSESSSGFTTHYGNIELQIKRVSATESFLGDTDYTSLGVSRFKKSTFAIGSSGAVRLKTATEGGDVDAATLDGENKAFYLNPNNISSTIPISKGGTGTNAVPSVGAILIGNGASYDLTTNPTIGGNVTANTFISNVATGTAPFTVSSTTVVSNLNADTVDGIQGSNLLRTDIASTTLLDLNAGIRFVSTNGTGNGLSWVDNTRHTRWDGRAIGTQTVVHKFAREAYQTGNFQPYYENWYDTSSYHSVGVNISGAFVYDGNTVWHSGNDGSGSGLDADALDGLDSTQFVRTDSSSSISGGNLTINGNIGNGGTGALSTWTGRLLFDADYSDTARGPNKIQLYNDGSAWIAGFGVHSDTAAYYSGGTHKWYKANGQTSFTEVLALDASGNLTIGGSTVTAGGNTVWHSGNDGAGSGLDADNLDGLTWDSAQKNLRGTEIYADNWFRNYDSGEGIYNEANAMYWYSDSNARWRLRSNQTTAQIIFATSGNATRGYVYATNSNEIGFLDSDGNWAMRHVRDSYTEFRDNNEVQFYIGLGAGLGDYGTVATAGNGKGNWEGYSINGRVVFMHDGSNSYGLYDDVNNQWMLYGQAAGSTDRYVQLRHNNTARLQTSSSGVSITGDLTVSGNVISNSDIRIKKDIEVIPNALDKVSELRGVTFNRIDIENNPRQSGVIAQEVEKVLPEVVSTDEDGLKSVAYGNLVGLLIEAIKELNEKIDRLEGR